jgi:small subunit ribosomal protein S1
MDFEQEASQEEDKAAAPESQAEAGVHPMDALIEAEEYDLESPRRGQITTGTIARVTEGDILVDIGAKSEGVISARELERLTEEERTELKVGEEITVYVLRSGNQGNTPILSLARAEEERDWQEVEELLDSQGLYEGEISGFNKGGLIVKVGRLRGFIPASQVSLARRRRAEGETPDKRWGSMVGEPVVGKVIEVDRRRNRLILSERAAAREAREAMKEKLIEKLEPGEIRTGHVISLADFGAFVDIGGADGLVHISEISWKRTSNPREVLKVGQEVKVKVLGVDPERNRISLSMRELEEDPWEMILDTFSEGQLVEGTITKLTKFGAFASLAGLEEYEIEGLIHISELSDQHITHPKEIVLENQILNMRIIKIDRDRRRIGLSLKRVDSAAYAEQDWKAAMSEMQEPSPDPVEDFDAELEAEEALDLEAEESAPVEDEATTSEAEAETQMETESDELGDELETVAEEVVEQEPAQDMEEEVDTESDQVLAEEDSSEEAESDPLLDPNPDPAEMSSEEEIVGSEQPADPEEGNAS